MSASRFTAPLYTADVGRVENNRPIRVILRAFAYGIDSEHDADRIHVPVGFCSDGNSVPAIFRILITPWGRYAQAAIVHDLLYATNAIERDAADKLFREAILVLGRDTETDRPTVGCSLVAYLVYWAVRLGGQSAYLNGRYTYPELATRAYNRAYEKDRPLAPIIVRTVNGLMHKRVMRGDAKQEAEESVLKGS